MKKHYLIERASRQVIERVRGAAVYDLPPSLSREIGRIIVHWAYFEHCVQEMNWQALGISDEAGRLAVRDPRVTDRLEMLSDLIKLRKGTWDQNLYKSIYAKANLLAAKRHLLVHGIWFHYKAAGEWHVQLTRGSWPKNKAELISGSKKVNPESITITPKDLRAATSEIVALIADLKALGESAQDPPTPSPETHP